MMILKKRKKFLRHYRKLKWGKGNLFLRIQILSIAKHLFIIITDPDKEKNYLIVPVTTFRDVLKKIKMAAKKQKCYLMNYKTFIIK